MLLTMIEKSHQYDWSKSISSKEFLFKLIYLILIGNLNAIICLQEKWQFSARSVTSLMKCSLYCHWTFEKTDYCSWKLFIETMLAGLKKWTIGWDSSINFGALKNPNSPSLSYHHVGWSCYACFLITHNFCYHRGSWSFKHVGYRFSSIAPAISPLHFATTLPKVQGNTSRSSWIDWASPEVPYEEVSSFRQ